MLSAGCFYYSNDVEREKRKQEKEKENREQ